jgi:hypothetical protein
MLGAVLTKGKHQTTPCLFNPAPARVFPMSSSLGCEGFAAALVLSTLNIQQQ